MTSCLQCGHGDPGGFLYCPKCGAKAVEGMSPRDPLLGRTLSGKYRIETEIGQGAMGTVYLGEHIGLKKKIALKILHKDLQLGEETLQRFQREGIAAGKFNHPHAIQIFDFDRAEGGIFYLAMEYVEGVNLGVFLRQRGRLPLGLGVRLARQMLSCLAEAHRHGIVHRDFKPENIMVSEASRGELRVKVLDFGLSKLVDMRMGSSLVTQPGRLLGTPLYMAPEQVAGEEADARSDVYAAGLILYEMLAGARPFREENATQLFLTRPTAEAPSLAQDHPELGVPETLDHVLLGALQRDRAQRFQSAEEMLAALDEVPFDTAASGTRSRGASTYERRVLAGNSTSVASSGAPAAPIPAGTAPAVPAAKRPLPAVRKLVFAFVVIAAFLALLWKMYDREAGAGARPARVRQLAADQRNPQEQRYLGLLDEARLALRGSDSKAAITAVNQAFLLECRDAEAFFVRAEIYRAKGDLDTALEDFRAAAQADGAFAEPLLGMGWIQLENGAFTPAEESFKRAGEIAPESAPVLAARGALAWEQHELEAAGTLLAAAVAKDPTCAPAHLYLGRLRLDQGDHEGAIAALVEAKRNDTFSTRPLVWLAEAYLAKEDFAQADVQLAEALRLDPLAATVRIQRGALLLDRGRTGEALEFLKESTERVPQEGKLWILRGIACEETGDDAGAIDALKRGFEQGAHDAEARCFLGALYQRQKKLPEAIAQYETVLQEDGDVPVANLDLGLALFAQEKYTEAAARFQRVLDFDEENSAAHFHLGLLHKDYLGDPAKAREHLERYVALGGTDPRVAGWIEQLR